MLGQGRRIRVFPDAARVEEALLARAESAPFVDASAFLTFAQLLDFCKGAEWLGRRTCSALTARIVLQGAARDLGPGPYGGFVAEPTFARSALELIFDLKSGRTSPVEFAESASALPASRAPRAQFLARLYSSYEERMAALKLADREDVVLGAIASLERRGLPPRLHASSIEVAHIYDFPQLRIEFMLALARECDRCGVSFRLEAPAAGSPLIDSIIDPLLAEFERRGQSFRHVELAKADFGAQRPLSLVGRSLFSPAGRLGGESPGARLALFSAGTARDEARQLALRALEFVEQGTPPDRIAIAFRDLDEEAEWVAEALDEIGLPARIRRGAPLASTAVGRLAFELALLADDDFPADRVARILSSRYAPALSQGMPESPERVFAWAAVRDDALGACGRKGAYEVRLTALAQRLQASTPPGRADALLTVLERCRKLIQLCRQIPEQGRCVELLRRWWAALSDLGLKSAIRRKEQRAGEDTALGRSVLQAMARDQAAAEALQTVAAELETALKLAGAASLPVHRRTFHRLLLDASADFNLVPHGPRCGEVQVLDIRELSGRGFAKVLIGGLVDGRFPARRRPNALLPDEDRLALNQAMRRAAFRVSAGAGESALPWRLAEDRLLLFLAISAAEESVVFSYARLAPDGREQAGSPFFEELRRLTGAELVHIPSRPAPVLDEVASESKLRERVAIELLSRPELRVCEPDRDHWVLRKRFEKEDWLIQARELTCIEEERLRYFSNRDTPPGPFAGRVNGRENSESLRQLLEFGRERPLSASTLARFGNCAFRGFLVLALGLEEPDAPDEEMDAKGQGSFWHHVLEELFTRLKAAGLVGRPARDVPDKLIEQSLETASSAAERRGHVGHPLLWRLDRQRARAMVDRLLRSEHQGLPFEQLAPERAELHFGREGAADGWREVKLPDVEGGADVFVAGKIDRMDTGHRAVAVVDYKSGQIKTPKQLASVLLETEFQLPLYLYAVRSAGSLASLDAALLSLKTGKVTQLGEALHHCGDATVDELISIDPATRRALESAGRKNLANAVHRLLAQLRGGLFPIRPRDCTFCAFQPVCRITERRFDEVAW
jgi:superfamily I DNA/RNA helicase/RecB family exonuclease